ncbi:MAG TPA: tripartite tricarboxylate transporter substrate binding protein, partial [Terrimesophilobacter sp.]|nr:tripartite tricarboxylate transporter substrate binding protein [Terrimesophilobacter sp.]
ETDEPAADAYPFETIEILAPGGIGGGWDTRARALETALTQCGIVDVPVRVTNIPGAGGTIGLAYFAQHEGDPHHLMVMSTITMLGGIIANQSEFELTQFTPIAGLTTGPN